MQIDGDNSAFGSCKNWFSSGHNMIFHHLTFFEVNKTRRPTSGLMLSDIYKIS